MYAHSLIVCWNISALSLNDDSTLAAVRTLSLVHNQAVWVHPNPVPTAANTNMHPPGTTTIPVCSNSSLQYSQSAGLPLAAAASCTAGGKVILQARKWHVEMLKLSHAATSRMALHPEPDTWWSPPALAQWPAVQSVSRTGSCNTSPATPATGHNMPISCRYP